MLVAAVELEADPVLRGLEIATVDISINQTRISTIDLRNLLLHSQRASGAHVRIYTSTKPVVKHRKIRRPTYGQQSRISYGKVSVCRCQNADAIHVKR